MKRFLLLLGSALLWAWLSLLVILWTFVVALAFLLTVAWDRRRRIVGRIFRGVAYMAGHVNPFWRVSVHGHLPAERDRAYVVVSNHESLADVMIIGGLPWEMKWLSKRAIGRIPFQGWMMRMAGDVFVRRRDDESRAEAFEKLREWLRRGVPVMIFPEGTRAPTDEMLPFRNGAFRLAVETGAPVLPLAIVGTRDALRKGSMAFQPARPRLAILNPVPVEGLGPDDVEPLRERVRALIAAARENLEEERSMPVSRARRRPPALSALLLILAMAAPALAQDADREERRGWRGSLEFGLTLTEGNSQTTNLSAGGTVIHRLERQRWTLEGSLLRATSAGEETANRGGAQVQYDFFPLSRFFVFGRFRAGYNRPAGISRRLTYGLGSGYTWTETERLTLSTEAGASFISGTFQNDSTSNDFFAFMGERLSLVLAEGTRLNQSLTFQPKFEDPGNFLAQGEVALLTRLVGALGLQVRLVSEYDSSPFVDAEGERRERHDLTFITGLTYEF